MKDILNIRNLFKQKRVWVIVLSCVVLISFLLIMNIETITRQGINDQVYDIKIPLYHKIFNLLDRHLNYKWLLGRILQGETNDSRKALLILNWTIDNIAHQPDQLKIIDDHVWNIVIRGYGMDDQLADVYATLCNYAGLKSFILNLHASSGTTPRRISLAAVFFDGSWHLCDPYRRVQFKDKSGKWATVNDIVSFSEVQAYGDNQIDYSKYFNSIKNLDYDALYSKSRSRIQDPISRFYYYIHTKM